jgi:DNA (cytosine-5)-methyltransferase 1
MLGKPWLLDLYCGAGGAAMGYYRAGFEIVGVDIAPQPHYPFRFIKADAIEYLRIYGHRFDCIHASPPCQRFSKTQRIYNLDHPDLIQLTRSAMPKVPYVIENVPGAPLIKPVTLCGHFFKLGTYRHRLFESNVTLTPPPHQKHDRPLAKMGRAPRNSEMMHVVGHFSDINRASRAMGIWWMTRSEITQAIPPAYTEFIGKQLMVQLL